MPIVIVRSLPPSDRSSAAAMLRKLTEGVAGGLGCAPGDVWAYWHEVGAAAMGDRVPSFDGHCPIVTIMGRSGRSSEAIAAGLRTAATAVGAALGLPFEDVWVHWVDLPDGRVFAGGRLL